MVRCLGAEKIRLSKDRVDFLIKIEKYKKFRPDRGRDDNLGRGRGPYRNRNRNRNRRMKVKSPQERQENLRTTDRHKGPPIQQKRHTLTNEPLSCHSRSSAPQLLNLRFKWWAVPTLRARGCLRYGLRMTPNLRAAAYQIGKMSKLQNWSNSTSVNSGWKKSRCHLALSFLRRIGYIPPPRNAARSPFTIRQSLLCMLP
jgi:hypothetical protein